jgi:hypothetical protein
VGYVALFLLVANAEVAVNSITGLETTFFMFLIAASMARALRENHRPGLPWSSLLFGVAALTRPEGLAFFALHLLFQAAVVREKPGRILLRLGLFVLVVLPHWVWRMAYYGQPLPATYYAKMSPLLSRLTFGGSYVLPFMLLYLVIVLAAVRWSGQPPRYLVWMTLGGIAVAWWEGGDWMIGHRFLMPVVPPWSLLAAGTVSALYDRLSRVEPRLRMPARRTVVAALLAAPFVILSIGEISGFRYYTAVRAEGYDRAHLALARWLDEHYDASATVALMDVGIVGYYSNLRVLDITGLTDIVIARAPGSMLDKVYDAAYLLDQNLEVIVLLDGNDDLVPDYPIERRLYNDERFQAAYKLHHTLDHSRDPKMGNYVLLVFVRQGESDIAG